jgi:large subunit ribosomal protein L4
MAETKSTPAKASLPKAVFAVRSNKSRTAQTCLRLISLRIVAKQVQQHCSVVKSAVVVKSLGSKRALAVLDSVAPATQFGAVVVLSFGPRGNENYKLKLSKTSKLVAVRQALTLANQAKKIIVTDVKTTGKTADIAKFFVEQKFDKDAKVLIVVDEKTPELMRATNNLQNALLVRASYLSVYYILNADKIVMTPAAVKAAEAWLDRKENA